MPYRVLHVSALDLEGGAARATHRLHRALRGIGVDSRMLVLHRRDAAADVLRPLGPGRRLWQQVRQGLSQRVAAWQRTPSNEVLHSLNWFSSGLGEWINRSDADVVNLHWVGLEMLSVEEIGRLRKPLCWTLHDMWPLCGAEHYDDLAHPGRYRGAYARGNRPPNQGGPDLDAWVWRRKRKAWAGRPMQLVSPSRWLAECAAQSALMRGRPCAVIPNCVDTTVFKPVERQVARRLLNLAPDKRYVLFGAMAGTSDRRKGFDLLQPALRQLARQPGVAGSTELLVFGAPAPATPADLGLPAHYLGCFHDDLSLALLYNAADVFVAPSRQDNLPNTLVEALACATPCVAFALGGMPDLIEPGVNGLLAEPAQADSLMAQLLRLLDAPPPRGPIREQAVRSRGADTVARQYLALYRSLHP